MIQYPRTDAVAYYTLAGGKRGIVQTLSLMRSLVDRFRMDPEIRSLALSLVKRLPQKDEIGEIETIFHFVRDGIRYVKDVYDVETLHTPDQILNIGQGDCDDKSVLLAALLEAVGYQTFFKAAGYHGSDLEHVYVIVNLAGNLIPLDSTEPEPVGWEAPGATAVLWG